MFDEVKEVKSKSKVVGSVTVTKYETVQELIDNVDEKIILDMFNKANVIAAQAKERQAHAPTRIGKGKKFELCMNKLTIDEMATCAGDFAAMETLALTKMPEVEADLAAAAGTTDVAETVEEVEVE
jgi:hypothetical protein